MRREADALSHDRALVDALLQTAPTAVLVLDEQGRIEHVNGHLEELGGWALDEVRGKDWFETFVPERDRDRARTEFEASLQETPPADAGATAIVTRSGAERLIEWRRQALRDDEGAATRLLAVGVDVTERDSLVDQTGRLMQLLDGVGDAIMLTDLAGHVTEWNRGAEQMYGYNAEEMVGESVGDLVSPDERDFQQAGLIASLTAGGPRTVEVPRIHRSGREIIVSLRLALIHGSDGEPVGMAGYAADITERKRAEDELRRNAERLQLALDTIDAAIFEQDAELRYTWMYQPQLGYSPEAVIGRTDAELLDPEGARAATEIKRRAFDRGERVRGEIAAGAGSETRHFDLIVEPRRDGDDRVVGLTGVSVDVTDRQRAEEALQASEARLTQAQQIARIGSWELDPTSGDLTWSDEIFRIFELDPAVFGASYEAFLDAIHPDDRAAVDAAYMGSLEAREPYEIVHRLLMPDGRVKHVHERCETDYDEAGKPLRSRGTVQDITDRVRADDALREADARLRVVLSNAPITIYALDDQGVFTLSEGKGLERVGLAPGENVGTSALELYASLSFALPDGTAINGLDMVNRVLAGETLNAVSRLGDDYFDNQLVPYRDAEGRVIGLIGVATVITDRVRAEEEARDSRALLQAIVDSTPDFIFVKDPSHRYTFLNRAFAVSRGLSPEEIIGRPDTDFWPADAFQTERTRVFHAADAQALSGQTVHIPNVPAAMPDGSERVFDTVKVPLAGPDGRAVRVLTYSRDVTERVRTQEAVEESERLFRTLAQVAPVGIFRTDPAGECTYANEQLCELTGRRREALLGTGWSSAVHPEDWARVLEEWARAVSGRARFASEYRLQRPDGEEIWVLGRVEAEEDARGEVAGYVGTITDITRRKQNEEAIRDLNIGLDRRVRERTAQLEAANRELETFTYTVSHDLKAPLRSIDGYSCLLLEDYGDRLDDDGRRLLDTARQAASHMSRLIDDLLAYSRLDRRELAATQLEPGGLIESVLAERADEVRARGVTVTVNVAGGPVTADRDAFATALRNLFENALKFLGDTSAPTIELACHETDAAFLLTVRDNGIGFDMRYHDRIFGIFQRLHRSEEFPGTGVGLAIVRRAVERMGGRVWAESEPGKGATFYLEIPR